MTSLVDGGRLALGTLTIWPVRAPGHVGREGAAIAMSAAPMVGAGLVAVPAGGIAMLDDRVSPAVLATAGIVFLAVATRAIHLDGLADTADGLGSGKPAPAALEIMRRSDIGPFGVVTLVLTLLIQVSALAAAIAAGHGVAAVLLAGVWSRWSLTWACRRGVPPARTDGLGVAVAGSVGGWGVAFATGVTGAVSAGALLPGPGWPYVLASGLLVILVATTVVTVLTRRLGGMTGDTLGCCVEVTFAAALLPFAF